MIRCWQKIVCTPRKYGCSLVRVFGARFVSNNEKQRLSHRRNVDRRTGLKLHVDLKCNFAGVCAVHVELSWSSQVAESVELEKEWLWSLGRVSLLLLSPIFS